MNILNKKIGLAYPIKSDIIAFNQTDNLIDEKRNELLHLLNTYRGEIPFNLDFGVRISDIVFTNYSNSEITSIIYNDISQQLAKWLPDVKLKEENIKLSSQGNIVIINLLFTFRTYEINFEIKQNNKK